MESVCALGAEVPPSHWCSSAFFRELLSCRVLIPPAAILLRVLGCRFSSFVLRTPEAPCWLCAPAVLTSSSSWPLRSSGPCCRLPDTLPGSHPDHTDGGGAALSSREGIFIFSKALYCCVLTGGSLMAGLVCYQTQRSAPQKLMRAMLLGFCFYFLKNKVLRRI